MDASMTLRDNGCYRVLKFLRNRLLMNFILLQTEIIAFLPQIVALQPKHMNDAFTRLLAAGLKPYVRTCIDS